MTMEYVPYQMLQDTCDEYSTYSTTSMEFTNLAEFSIYTFSVSTVALGDTSSPSSIVFITPSTGMQQLFQSVSINNYSSWESDISHVMCL